MNKRLYRQQIKDYIYTYIYIDRNIAIQLIKTETTLPTCIALSLPTVQPVAWAENLSTTHLEILKGVFASILSSFAMLSRWIISISVSIFSTEFASFFAKNLKIINYIIKLILYLNSPFLGSVNF